MKSETTKQDTGDWGSVVSALEALREELGRLNARVASLEVATSSPSSTTTTTASAAPVNADRASHPGQASPGRASPAEMNEELVLVLSAAIAAYLGVKPHIRQIRLLGGGAWAEHGRATIQASHVLTHLHG